jgi:hypothetical protein
MVNLAVVLNTELDHTLDELGKVRRRLQNCVLSAQHATIWMVVLPPVWIQHPYRSPPCGRFDYGTQDCRTRIDLDP